MTFQPPPSPPGGTPPPPPPGPQPGGQWNPPPGGPPGPGGYGPGGPGRQSFDPKTVNPLDWGIVAAGALAFIFSLFDYYSASAFGYSTSESAFGDGFLGWFAALLALAATVVIAMTLFKPQVNMPAAPRLIALGLFAVAFLCSLITLFLNPTDVPDKYFSHGFGYWASLILIIVATVLTLMRFQQTGGQLPGGMSNKVPNIGGHRPQGGMGAGPQGGMGAGPQGGMGAGSQGGMGAGPQGGMAPGQPQGGMGAGPGGPAQPGPGSTPPPPPPPPGYGPPPGQ